MSGLGADAAWLGPMPWLLVLAPAWPLTLLAALALPPLRAAVARLAPWAPLPALLIAAMAPQTNLPLPGLMLGGSFQLDDTGRWLLAAVALLWLAGGWPARDWLCQPRRAAAWLLAMAGALWLPLAGDLPSALAASVLAAYPLYGLLGGSRGGRALLASVVVGDLLILEAVLLLAKGSTGLDFDSLRAALAEVGGRGIVLALLVLGFGAKAGVMGLHYWLSPAIEDAHPRQLGPVLAFALAAGLLPLLRLLPSGEATWPLAGAVLPWLALAGGGWAVVVGLLQAAPRARVAYALSALASLWLGLLGLAWTAPLPAPAPSAMLSPAMALSGLGLAALLLASAAGRDSLNTRPDRQQGLAAWSLAPLSALLVLLAVLGGALSSLLSGALPAPLLGSLACVGVLLGASVPLPTRAAREGVPGARQRAAAVLVAAGLAMAVLVALSPEALSALATSPRHGMVVITVALLGGFVLGPVAVAALARLPRLPAGDLLVPIERAVAALVAAWRRFGLTLGQGRDRLDAAMGRIGQGLSDQAFIEAAERRLGHWSTATLLLVLLGAVVALLLQPG
jgi:hydrogenase-4 component B